MIAIAAGTFVVVIIIAAVVLVSLRRWTLDEGRAEARLRAPDTHKVVYVVPEGEDPTLVMAALMHAGFKAVVGLEEGIEQVLVECEETDRAGVRELIARVSTANSKEHGLPVTQIQFEDEAERQP
jgi:hypothetical protein